MFSDLECDYINPIDLCNKLNQVCCCLFFIHCNFFNIHDLSIVCTSGESGTRISYATLPHLGTMDGLLPQSTFGTLQCWQVSNPLPHFGDVRMPVLMSTPLGSERKITCTTRPRSLGLLADTKRRHFLNWASTFFPSSIPLQVRESDWKLSICTHTEKPGWSLHWLWRASNAIATIYRISVIISAGGGLKMTLERKRGSN